jgi:hypothetical protein
MSVVGHKVTRPMANRHLVRTMRQSVRRAGRERI